MEFQSPAVMAYVLWFCQHGPERIVANATKAQHLLYCCYGAVLASADERLTDEHPRAWPFGPVFPRTMRAIEKNRLTVEVAEAFERDCPSETLALIRQTIRVFSAYSAASLSAWSRRLGSPWAQAESLAALDDRAVRLHFEKLLPIIRRGGVEAMRP